MTRYESDRTQGPACAIAAGAATIYRNYFVPVGGAAGQTRARQLDAPTDVGIALCSALDLPVDALWSMRNGDALCTPGGLHAISAWLSASMPAQIDALRGLLKVGVHRDVEVADAITEAQVDRPIVSQVFCSALPVSYTDVPPPHWATFASLVLEAAYEATPWAALESVHRGQSNTGLLTRLGGDAFGNNEAWIVSAMRKALQRAAGWNLDVRIVSYGTPSRALLQLSDEFA